MHSLRHLSACSPSSARLWPRPAAVVCRISWIDVEGGASTLFAAPNGQSLLFDTGFPGNDDRDAKRIVAAAKAIGLTRIDHVVISHWHTDHVGGLPALAKLLPLGTFYDHGDGVEEPDRPLYEGYKTIAGTERRIVRPGDTMTLGDVRVRVLVAEGPVIADAVNGGTANPLCANAVRQEPAAPENIRMVGLAINYGPFRMATLGDADWSRELELACPVNKLGRINLYTINRHGSLDNSGAPALLGAIQPQVIVVNNGPRKGLGQKVAVKYLHAARRDARPVRVELVSPAREAARHRGHLARAPVTARCGPRAQHRARHDCQPRGGSRRPGAFDHGGRVGRRHLHGDELAKRIRQNVPSAVICFISAAFRGVAAIHLGRSHTPSVHVESAWLYRTLGVLLKTPQG